MKQETREKIRRMSEELSAMPAVCNLVGSMLYQVAQGKKRRLSKIELDILEQLDVEEEKIIPNEILYFLKAKKNIAIFFDYVRENIYQKIESENISTDNLAKYSVFFNTKMLAKKNINNNNKARLLFICCLEEEGCEISALCSEKIDEIFEKWFINPKPKKQRYLRALREFVGFTNY